MSDIVDLTNDFAKPDKASPYGEGPFRMDSCLFVIQKRGSIYFVSFTSLIPPFKGQQWSDKIARARRFDNTQVAAEYSKFIDRMDCKIKQDGATQIILVREANPLPMLMSHPAQEVEVRRSALQYMTQFDGVHARR